MTSAGFDFARFPPLEQKSDGSLMLNAYGLT